VDFIKESKTHRPCFCTLQGRLAPCLAQWVPIRTESCRYYVLVELGTVCGKHINHSEITFRPWLAGIVAGQCSGLGRVKLSELEVEGSKPSPSI
jgi:hypothetical protein